MRRPLFRRESPRASRKVAVALLSALAFPVVHLSAQEPPPIDAAALPADESLPVLPELVVPGRPLPFPSEPLETATVVTPGRGTTTTSETGSAMTVITADEMRERRQPTVLEALRGSAGLDVVQTGGPGRPTSVFLRGANSEHTKVLLDGIPLNNPADPTRRFDFSALSVDNIERIEIVRGPQSVVYGSDAIGGVINIVTKRGDGPLSFRASGMGGSFGTQEERISLSGGNDSAYYSFGASYFQNDGFSAVSRRFGTTEADGYRNTSLSGRFGWNPTENLNVDYVFRYSDADIDIDGYDPVTFLPADILDRQNRLNQFFNRVQVQSQAWDGILEQKLGFSLTNFITRDTKPGFFDVPRFDGQGRQIDWQGSVQVTENNVFSTGVDYFAEEASPFAGGLARQNLASVYVQDRFSWRDFSHTSVGFRWDDHSVAGTAQTYRLTQVFDVSSTGGRMHASLGRGFRAPAISQRFGAVGNVALRPEFSKGWDVGFEQPMYDGTLVWDATYFRNDFDDLIIFVPGPFGPFGFGQLRNVQAARTSGVEVTATTQITPRASISAAYTYTDTLDRNNDTHLLRRPRNKVGINFHHELSDRATWNAYVLFVGNRTDFDAFGTITTLPDYATVNLSGTYQLNDRWQAFGRIDNLTNTDYEEVFAFATPGISGYAGASFTW